MASSPVDNDGSRRSARRLLRPRSIKSAERALGLFELFSRCQQPLRVSEISEGMHIPQPSASMLVRRLVDLGYLEYEPLTRAYTPSIRIVLLGGWIGRRIPEARSFASRLDELHRLTGELVYVGMQNGPAVQVVQRRGDAVGVSIDSGRLLSLTCSATGRMLLSMKPDSEVVRLVRRSNAEASVEQIRVNESAFLRIIAGIRRNGYAQSHHAVGQTSIAVAVVSPTGQMPLAVGCGGPIERMKDKHELILKALLIFQEDLQLAAS